MRELVIEGAPEITVIVKVALPEPPGFVALMVTAFVPSVVGVPLMRPVAEFRFSPDGRLEAP